MEVAIGVVGMEVGGYVGGNGDGGGGVGGGGGRSRDG